jgi:hypothetical protein
VRFKEPAHLKLIAPIMLALLELPSEPASIGAYRRLLIDKMCRELEKLVKIGKSRRAEDNARRGGFHVDLSEHTWADRGRLDGRHEDGFHFEHTETVYELVQSLMSLRDPTLEDVEAILARARVTWVTKRENEKLDELGYKSRRPDWRKAYQDAGIELADDE